MKGWGVSLTTLMNERVSIGGQVHPRGSGLIALVMHVYEQHAKTAGGVARDQVTKLWIEAEVNRLTNIRASQVRKKGTPGPEGSVGKLAMALLNQRMMDFTMDLMGPEAMLYPAGYPMSRPTTAMDLSSPQKAFIRVQANSIEGGTTLDHEEHPRRAGARPARRHPGRQGPPVERGAPELGMASPRMAENRPSGTPNRRESPEDAASDRADCIQDARKQAGCSRARGRSDREPRRARVGVREAGRADHHRRAPADHDHHALRATTAGPSSTTTTTIDPKSVPPPPAVRVADRLRPEAPRAARPGEPRPARGERRRCPRDTAQPKVVEKKWHVLQRRLVALRAQIRRTQHDLDVAHESLQAAGVEAYMNSGSSRLEAAISAIASASSALDYGRTLHLIGSFGDQQDALVQQYVALERRFVGRARTGRRRRSSRRRRHARERQGQGRRPTTRRSRTRTCGSR